MEIPRLVPIKSRTNQQQRVSVHERLGRRDSITSVDSAITIQVNNGVQSHRKQPNNLKRLNNNNQNNGRISVQHRLNKNFVNPAIVARNNFSVNAINSFMESAMKTFGGADPDESIVQNGNFMAALASRMMTTINKNKTEPGEHKYNMNVQKEISAIQVRERQTKQPNRSIRN